MPGCRVCPNPACHRCRVCRVSILTRSIILCPELTYASGVIIEQRTHCFIALGPASLGNSTRRRESPVIVTRNINDSLLLLHLLHHEVHRLPRACLADPDMVKLQCCPAPDRGVGHLAAAIANDGGGQGKASLTAPVRGWARHYVLQGTRDVRKTDPAWPYSSTWGP